ncbi:hypothetical protein KPL70_023626 [Citrus sinensis]|nr:hypothetical protein KPL70_023626 [Citrus sinensis]
MQTYIRRNYRAKDIVLLSLHNQESEPRVEPVVFESSGKNSSNPNFDDFDLPIASRKRVHSCTKYPMSNYISYDKLSPNFLAFTSQLSSVEIPKNIHEALRVPEWRKAIEEEMRALGKNQIWEVTDLPKGKKTVGCKWVFTIKYNSNGTLERYKARLVAKRFTQTYGIDYLETFTPVAKLNTVRVLLSMALNLDWPLQQLDVKNAFLNGDLVEEVYVDSPPGFKGKFQYRICKLKKSLYSLKQSPRAWFEKFTRSVKGDDLIEMERLKKSLAFSFEIKDLGTLRYFLGMEVARSRKGLVVSQWQLSYLEKQGSAEAKYRAMAHGVCEMLCLKQVLR